MSENVGPLSGRPPTEIQGPRRRAPRFYAGEHWGRYRMQHKDVDRHPNGALPGVRDKAARRVIRAAFARSVSRVEGKIRFARSMRAQAMEVADDEGKSTRWGRRLLAKELSIHQAVYVPDKKTRRAMRTQARKDKRAGKVDAISALVDRMQK